MSIIQRADDFTSTAGALGLEVNLLPLEIIEEEEER